MFEKLAAVERRFEAIEAQLVDPAVLTDRKIYTTLLKEHAELKEIVDLYRAHQRLCLEMEEARLFFDDQDQEIRRMAKNDVIHLQADQEKMAQVLRRLLIPKDPLDDSDIFLEIRAGTGGDEAALFAGDLFEMYCRYAQDRRWKVEVISESYGTKGGYKEVIAMLRGKKVYGWLKYEIGVHRVQRVPTTESQGRIHTSACTVAILPEAEDVDVDINEKDLIIDTFRSSGAGGQHVNKTDSAIRITHKPSGLVVSVQDERSQHKNKARALKVLRSRLFDRERERIQSERSSARRDMVGSGDRSERIRTYNFPQNRITDHRIGLTLHSLDRVLSTGDLSELVGELRAHDQALRLQQLDL